MPIPLFPLGLRMPTNHLRTSEEGPCCGTCTWGIVKKPFQDQHLSNRASIYFILVPHCFNSHGQANVGEITQDKDEFLTDVTFRVLEGFVYREQCLQRPVIVTESWNFHFDTSNSTVWPGLATNSFFCFTTFSLNNLCSTRTNFTTPHPGRHFSQRHGIY